MVTMNTDRVMKRGDYKNKDTLRVTSSFRTIQGEGPFAGYPAVFLRLAGCNFGDKVDHCSWCDTAFQYGQGTEMSTNDVVSALTSLPGYSPKDILVITGGEPLLQEHLHDLIKYVAVHGLFKATQIETNGTQGYFMSAYSNSEARLSPYFVVSPKASIKLKGYAPLGATVIETAGCLKFVVSADPQDVHHVVPSWAFSMPDRCPVYVSPMAVYKKPYAGEVSSIWDDELIDRAATSENYAYAARYAMENHFLLSLQTHLFTAVP